MPKESELRAVLENEPGDPIFADLIALLIAEGRFQEAIVVGLQGLSRNPECHKGRLLFAHALFRSEYYPFAAREVQILCEKFPAHTQLSSLLARLDPTSTAHTEFTPSEGTGEMADVEFDLDVLDQFSKKS